MIVLKYYESKKEFVITNMFDTAKEFKKFLDTFVQDLKETDDGVYDSFIEKFGKKLSFEKKLRMYTECTNEIMEII